jgi:hypothetical protein
VEPTLTTVEMQAGEPMASVNPSLPDATTGATPAARSWSNAGFSGSPSHVPAAPGKSPRLRFTAARLRPGSESPLSKRYSSAAMMSLSKAPMHGALPKHVTGSFDRENTWIAQIFAPLATPDPEAPVPPAAMPATWVPWSQSDKVQAAPEPGASVKPTPPGHRLMMGGTLVEKHASRTTLPARKGWAAATPVSRIATMVPVPS